MFDEERRLSPAVVADLLRTSMAQGQRPHLIITSGSMRPLLQIGDEVQLEPVRPHELQQGDIITLVAPATLITHRFWAMKAEANGSKACLVTRGDRFLTFDAPWQEDYLIGRVIARRRRQRGLSLVKGVGGWLGRHVAHIAAAENRIFQLNWQSAGQPLLSSAATTKSPLPFVTIQVRRLVYLWVTLVAAFINLFSSKRKTG